MSTIDLPEPLPGPADLPTLAPLPPITAATRTLAAHLTGADGIRQQRHVLTVAGAPVGAVMRAVRETDARARALAEFLAVAERVAGGTAPVAELATARRDLDGTP